MLDHGIDLYSQSLERVCQNENCQRTYSIRQYLESNAHYFPRPFNYRAGCDTYCLQCWLGIESVGSLAGGVVEGLGKSAEALGPQSFTSAVQHEGWPYEVAYDFLMDGDVLPAFQWFVERDFNLAVMPIARLHVERAVVFPGPIVFYPIGAVDLDQLNIVTNREGKNPLARLCSAAAGITREVLEQHSLVIFPCKLDWRLICTGSHETHLDVTRGLSEEVDRCCLNFVRYRSCILGPVPDEGLPAHAGQVASNPMMASALLYCGSLREGVIIGGAAFSHYLTRGIGLSLDQLEWDAFPKDGEVGQIVNHALFLYAALLEAPNPTARFMQAMNLLEFLACPDKYLKFKEAKKIIAPYIARNRAEYQKICNRFEELTGGAKDPKGGRNIGYRTKVVHMGERIERLVPDPQTRKQLFLELDGYIRPVIDHMIAHSEGSWADYLKARDILPRFDK